MTLQGKSGKRIGSTERIIYTDEGIKDIISGAEIKYPCFIGEVKIPNLSPEPLLVEFIKEGKHFFFILYDKRLGMIAKARMNYSQGLYVMREAMSKKGNIPKDGIISDEDIKKILFKSGGYMKVWREA